MTIQEAVDRLVTEVDQASHAVNGDSIDNFGLKHKVECAVAGVAGNRSNIDFHFTIDHKNVRPEELRLLADVLEELYRRSYSATVGDDDRYRWL